MPRGVQWVLGIALTIVVGIGLTIGATVQAAVQAGSLSVHVQRADGGDFHVAVPTAAANLAIAAVNWVPTGGWPADARPTRALAEIERYLPYAQRALETLAGEPDFVLVDVHEDGDHVRVQKRGRSLVVDADVDGDRYEVSVPLSTVREFGRALRRWSDAS